MSEPRRYDYSRIDGMMTSNITGKFVLLIDYENLRAENAALRAKMATMVCGTCLGHKRIVSDSATIQECLSFKAKFVPCPGCQTADARKDGAK